MEYITVRQAAEKWGVSPRLVQKYCAQGRVEGARKFGACWEIPAGAAKPDDPRRSRQPELPAAAPGAVVSCPGLLPLMNTPFVPGHCMETVQAMEEGPQREIALAEYHYFSGQAELAAQEAELYLTSQDTLLRLSACLLYGYASLSMGNIQQARYALSRISEPTEDKDQDSVWAVRAFARSTAAILLHLPLPADLPHPREYLPLLPPGLRLFGLYVRAHYAYLQQQYEKSIGMVEAALTMQLQTFPIPSIYLHLVAVMDYASLRQPEYAQAHLLAAWALARPDDLIEGLAEHHGLLGGMLEAVIKKDWPEDFKRIIAITYRFSAGWRKIHNPETGHLVADNLTTTEFAAAMLAARGWTNQEIARQMNISPNTVKSYISMALQKLNIRHRQDLKKYMLR